MTPGFAFDVIGDNTTSLAWCREGRAKSDLAHRANVALVLLTVDLGATVAETRHIAGVLNVVCDKLSRGTTGDELGLPADKFVALTATDLAYRYVAACDPESPLTTAADQATFAASLLDLLRGLSC